MIVSKLTKGKRRRSKTPNKDNVDNYNSSSSRPAKPKKSKGYSSSSFVGFLKKRAPIYLGIVGLFLIFVIPELTKTELNDILPELSSEDGRVVDRLLKYDGGDGSGLSVIDTLSDKIVNEFGKDVYGHKDTNVTIIVNPVPTTDDVSGIVPVDVVSNEIYDIYFELESNKGALNYTWTINVGTNEITTDDISSRHVIDLVRFYD